MAKSSVQIFVGWVEGSRELGTPAKAIGIGGSNFFAHAEVNTGL